VHESDADLRARAFRIMERFADLRLSYADCVGAAVADKVQASAVLGLDHDFRIMGYSLEP
jgi:predicted nucleic acid-binding protein